MRIAVVGSGIAGLSSAWLLSREHAVVLYEANDYLGGHTHTHDVEVEGRAVAVDTGFIVFNQQHYPLLSKLFRTLGVASKPTRMSFGVQNARTGLEYSTQNLTTLFCQKRNLIDTDFWRMLLDLKRFYRESREQLEDASPNLTLGAYLQAHGYSDIFRDDHIVPMAAALWSSSSRQILDFPLKHLLNFMANHQMLQLTGRPQWRVVEGGSQTYVRAMQQQWKLDVRLKTPVLSVQRESGKIIINAGTFPEAFDHVVLACHSYQSLSMLLDADEAERAILGALNFQHNDIVLHTDARMLPRDRRAWAAWNAYVPASDSAPCTVSYCMNILQSIDMQTPIVTSLNRDAEIDPAKILRRVSYAHPLQTRASVAAQKRKSDIQGNRNTWFAGAYWGCGFHEDGLRSGVDVANALGVSWP